MANEEHLAVLEQGVKQWNKWRRQNKSSEPDLRKADLHGADLSGADLSKADLRGADLSGADLSRADLSGADLSGADLSRANLRGACLGEARLFKADLSEAYLGGADLRGATLVQATLSDADLSWADLSEANLCTAELLNTNLSGAFLSGASLSEADLSGANLSVADLRGASLYRSMLIDTNFDGADLTGAQIFGISAWGVSLEGTIQKNLIIQPSGEDAPITLDDLEVAQFIYLLLNNKRVRHIIDTITSKVVLILGRFTPERKAILDALRDELRRRDYLPILFDFDKPSHRDLTETISTLAHMARFVVADITDARSIPQELIRIVPNLPSVPVQPLLLATQQEYGMFADLRRYPWVLEPVLYEDQDGLLRVIADKVIGPAETKANEQTNAGQGISVAPGFPEETETNLPVSSYDVSSALSDEDVPF
jgi:uncharacterized protein YjbI with pentapeptide repeats